MDEKNLIFENNILIISNGLYEVYGNLQSLNGMLKAITNDYRSKEDLMLLEGIGYCLQKNIEDFACIMESLDSLLLKQEIKE